jgi:uncharacterized protein with von Willebrand factor type A (vWA) domain
MAEPLRRHSTRYSAYTGGPDPLAPPVDLREALEQIGHDVMGGTSPRRALSELLRRGTENMTGADRLAAEANRRRRELLRNNNLDGTLQEIKKLLDEAVLAERKELARALDPDIASKRSWSVCAKFAFQRQRNVAVAMRYGVVEDEPWDKIKSWIVGIVGR